MGEGLLSGNDEILEKAVQDGKQTCTGNPWWTMIYMLRGDGGYVEMEVTWRWNSYYPLLGIDDSAHGVT